MLGSLRQIVSQIRRQILSQIRRRFCQRCGCLVNQLGCMPTDCASRMPRLPAMRLTWSSLRDGGSAEAAQSTRREASTISPVPGVTRMLHVGCLKYWNIPAPPPGTGLSSMNRNRCVVVRTDYSGRGTEISSPSPIRRDVSGGENFLLTHFGNLGNSLRREMTRLGCGGVPVMGTIMWPAGRSTFTCGTHSTFSEDLQSHFGLP